MIEKWKETEIGRIPEDWDAKKICEIDPSKETVQTGPFGSMLHAHDYAEEGIPLLLVKNIAEGRVTDKDIPKVNFKKAQELKKFWLREGDIVFTRVGAVGRTLYITRDYEGWMFSGQTLRLRIKSNQVNNQFIEYFFRSPKFQNISESTALGTTRPSINTSILANTYIPIPPIIEQNKIVEILSSLDSKIILNRQMNSTLEAIGQALFKHWFVDFEFPDEEGKPYRSSGGEMVDSELGEVPREWKIKKIGDLVAINEKSIDKQYKYDVIEYIDISSVTAGRLTETKIYTLKDAPSRAKRIVRHGDTIWSTVRPNLKSFLYINSPSENLIVSTGFAVLTPKQIPSTFLYYWVTTEDFVNYLSYSADGSAYPAVNTAYIANADIILPPKEILIAFDTAVSSMRNQIAYNEKQSHTLAAVRDALLLKLMSGEIRVNVPEKELEATA